MHFQNKPANEKVYIATKKYDIPQHHHQNSIHIFLHHSTTNCILKPLFHVILYHQTEMNKLISKKSLQLTNFLNVEMSNQWLCLTYCIHHLVVVCKLMLWVVVQQIMALYNNEN